MLCLSLLLLAVTAQAQQPILPASPTTCDYTSEPASISLTAQNVPVGYSTVYLLVNMTSGMIVQANQTAPVFNGVPRGLYYAVPAHYSGVLNNASAGKLISDVYSTDQCLIYGTTLGLRVCDSACDYASAPASISFTAQNVPSGVNTTYVLVDESTNLIVQTNSTASFSGLAIGEYAITSVHYTGSLTALAAGNRLYDVTTQNRDDGPVNCLTVSNTLHIRVCNSPVAITGPPDGATVASVNPPISGTASPGASVTVTGGPGSTGGPCVTTADAGGNWTCTGLTFPEGPASVTATDGSTTAVSGFTVALSAPPTTVVIVRPRVFLAGAYVASTGLMRDDLRTKSLIPLSDPYSTTALTTSFTHTAGSAGTSIAPGVLSVTGNDAIVDWVFVQLHDPVSASAVIMTRSALVQRDGDIVDLDGTSPLSFTASPGSFYLSVRHRNHLGVMTLNTVALSSTAVTVDFTNPATATYGTYAQRIILPTSPNSVTATALWAGNANSNKNVIYQGSGNDLGMILSQIYMASSNSSQDKTFILSQYLTGDLNLDGNVIYQGSGNELGTVLGTVLLFPDNITATKIYIVSEQLP